MKILQVSHNATNVKGDKIQTTATNIAIVVDKITCIQRENKKIYIFYSDGVANMSYDSEERAEKEYEHMINFIQG